MIDGLFVLPKVVDKNAVDILSPFPKRAITRLTAVGVQPRTFPRGIKLPSSLSLAAIAFSDMPAREEDQSLPLAAPLALPP